VRIVLDTNVLLVAISRKTVFHAIWERFLEGRIELCVTSDILSEYAEMLEQKFNEHVAFNIMKTFEDSPDIIFITKYYFWNLITIDPDDNKFVDCAVAAGADFIITNDKHFKVLKDIPFPKVEVLNDDEFLKILNPTRF